MDATLPSSRRGSPTRHSSTVSTPFVSAPSSPGHSNNASYLTNVPTGPSRLTLDIRKSETTGMAIVVPASWDDDYRTGVKNKIEPVSSTPGTNESEDLVSFSALASASDFDFSARFSEVDGAPWSPGPMSTAEELFHNGQIRPLRLYFPSELEHSSAVLQQPGLKSDDGYFDFRSFASYNPPQSSRSSPTEEQKRQGFDLKPAIQANSSAWDEWKNMNTETRRITSVADNLKRLNEVQRPGERGSRRARSLSPLRVFHIDDQPRQSFESESCYSTISAGDVQDGNYKAAQTRGRRRKTLKELLHMSDIFSADESSAQHEIKSSKVGKKCDIAMWSEKAERLRDGANLSLPLDVAPWRAKRSSSELRSPKQAVSPHELHYTTQRAQAEQMKKKTFLPYKHGFMGCLGFSSKRWRSFSGVHIFKDKP